MLKEVHKRTPFLYCNNYIDICNCHIYNVHNNVLTIIRNIVCENRSPTEELIYVAMPLVIH